MLLHQPLACNLGVKKTLLGCHHNENHYGGWKIRFPLANHFLHVEEHISLERERNSREILHK